MEKTYNCGEYGKVSNPSSELIQHQTLQNPQKENKCKKCMKAFTHSSNLSRDWIIHTDQKPFKYTIVGNVLVRVHILVTISESMLARNL